MENQESVGGQVDKLWLDLPDDPPMKVTLTLKGWDSTRMNSWCRRMQMYPSAVVREALQEYFEKRLMG